MPKLLEEYEGKKLYYFYSEQTGRKMRKFSGDEVSESEIKIYEIPEFLLERNDVSKRREGTGKDPSNKINR